jgi:hypothetical protein
LKKIQHHLSKSDGTSQWINALIEIASEDYADSDAVGKVIKLLQDIRANTEDSKTKDTELEHSAIEAHKKDIEASK